MARKRKFETGIQEILSGNWLTVSERPEPDCRAEAENPAIAGPRTSENGRKRSLDILKTAAIGTAAFML